MSEEQQYFISDDEESGISRTERDRILHLLPQKPPFRFIDSIDELSENHIVASYLFRGDEWFYQGHFEGDPVTPGVILVEAMAQAGLVALGLFLRERHGETGQVRTLFTESAVEFHQLVRPGTLVIVSGHCMVWRRNKLRSRVIARTSEGNVVAEGVLAGIGATHVS